MRVLLSTLGSRGDVEPLVALAVALKAQGADAVVCAPADVEFIELTDRAGVEFAPAFMPIRAFIAMARKDPKPLPERAADVAQAQFEAISAAAEGCDAVVGTGLMPSVAAAQCVAELNGLPWFKVGLCPMYLPSEAHAPHAYPGRLHPEGVTDNRVLWNHDIETINAIFGPAVNGLRTRLGLPVTDNVRDHVFTRSPFLASDATLWPWEPSDLCEAAQTGAWILEDDRPPSPELEAFLNAGEAPVYVGFGSLPTHDPKEAARIAIEAVRGQGRRIVLLRGWADLDRIDGGEDVLVIGEVNQQALFRRVAAVVHHGGAGTTTTAAHAGAPQVIVPQIVDQPFWARKVARLGIGAAHDGPVPTVDSLSVGLAFALRPETKARAAAIAAEVRRDGAAVAARLIVDRIGPVSP